MRMRSMDTIGRSLALALHSKSSLRDRARNLIRMLRKWARRGSVERRYQRMLDMTLREWLLYHHRHIHDGGCQWMGVRALKNPLDAWMYQEILWAVRPEVLVEIGSADGGSTLYFAHLFDALGHGQVLSVDVARDTYKVDHPRVATITGHSSAPEVVADVYARCLGRTVLVVHDGDHHKAQVLRDLRAYADLVSVGSYFIVEDGIVDLFGPFDGLGWVDDGPLSASEEFLREHAEFQVDESCERYLITYNPRGFLKRVG
jgi:cephalosporin hydroxylase